MRLNHYSRRKFLDSVFCSIATIGCCRADVAHAEWPGTKGRPAWPKSGTEPAQTTGYSGCGIHGAGAKSRFGALTGLSRSSGIIQLDQLVPSERTFLGDNFQVHPSFAFFDDSSSPNAFATPERILESSDGTVAFGRTLVGQQLRGNPIWGSAVAGIMAHEWAHILQFKLRRIEGWVRDSELQADFLAGWHLGKKVADGVENVPPLAMIESVEGLQRSLFDLGDYEFNNPQHHGTPRQRVYAMKSGMELAFVRNGPEVMEAFEEAVRFVETI